MIDRLPIEPFQSWIEQRIASRQKEYEHSAAGYGRVVVPPLEAVAQELGIPERMLNRYRRGVISGSENGQKGDFSRGYFPRLPVEDILWNAGVGLWEVYPQSEYPELYEVKDDEQLRDSYRLIHPDTLLRARALYEAGHSLRGTAKVLLVESRYASVDCLKEVLRREFHNQGWPVRSPGAANRTGGCHGLVAGRRCERRPTEGQAYCAFHIPGSLHGRGLPVEPFSRWVNERVREAGSSYALGRQWGINNNEIWRWTHRARRSPRGELVAIRWLRPETVKKVLALDGRTTFEELYGEALCS